MSREGLREQQRTVAVAEETETVREGVIVEASPLFADECRYQQQQRAFWLVKIGYHTRSQPVGETGHYHNLRGGLQLFGAGGLHVRGERAEQLRTVGFGR